MFAHTNPSQATLVLTPACRADVGTRSCSSSLGYHLLLVTAALPGETPGGGKGKEPLSMDKADIKLPPTRGGEQINPTLNSLLEKGTQGGPPPAQTMVAWGWLLPRWLTNPHTQGMAKRAPAHLRWPMKSRLPAMSGFCPSSLVF